MALFQHAYGPASISHGTESGLVERVRASDQLALEEIFNRYYDALCRFTMSLTHSRDDVEDLVQEIFVRIWINRTSWNPKGAINTYLFKAARNQSINFMKSKRESTSSNAQDDEELPSLDDEDPVKKINEKDAVAAVNQAIDKLPQKCRLVFTLNRWEGLSYAETAEILGISEKTVENQISHALKVLRRELSQFLE
ncbi:MAG TPA: RNA polymerase sigma-70 factor [Candidatus Kryptobacter bacterium]|nr:RNA polymerase sigma-70 factor [Candidatus Kryptobacter bacterium]